MSTPSPTWMCDECTTDNPGSNTECEQCSTVRPIQVNPSPPTNSTSSVKPPDQHIRLKRPRLLFGINRQGYLYARPTTISKIRSRLDPLKRTVILVAAGVVGTGKSTWINSLLFYLLKDSCRLRPFAVGHTAETQTEGLWVFPYLLTSPDDPKVQFLICDMEGMGGIKKQKAELVNKGLNKLYTATMLLSSVFTVHTHMRPDGPAVETLKKTAFMIRSQQEILVELPKIFMLVKDTEKVQTKSGQTSFVDSLKEYGDLDSSLLSLLKVMGRPELSKDARDNLSLPTLTGTAYMDFNVQFIKTITPFIKKNPATTFAATPEQICEHIIKIADIINIERYVDYFKGSIEEVVLSIINPVVEKYTTQFHEISYREANSFSTSKVDDFSPHLNKIRERLISEYEQEVKQLLSLPAESQVFKNSKARVMASIKSSPLAENQYLTRARHDSDKKELQHTIEKLLEENKKKEEKNANAMKQLKKKQLLLVSELEKSKTEREDLVQQVKNIQKEAEDVKVLYEQMTQRYDESIKKSNEEADMKWKKDNKIQAEDFEKFMLDIINSKSLSQELVETKLENMKKTNQAQRIMINETAEEQKKKVTQLEYTQGKKSYDKEDYPLAIAHFKIASENGEPMSCFYLGEIYCNGLGVEFDKPLALSYYNLALERGVRASVPKISALRSELRMSNCLNALCIPLSPRVPPPVSEAQTLSISVTARANNEKLQLQSSLVLPKVLSNDNLSFLSAIEHLQDIVVNIREYSLASYEFSKTNPQGNLTIDEIASINLYTREWSSITDSLYYKLNQALRENSNLAHFTPLITLMMSGLKKLPKWKGTVWRAVSFLDLGNLYEKNKVVSWHAFSSCTKSLSVVGGNGFLVAKGNRTLFNIEAVSGYSIESISVFRLENEVLFLPGVRFQVVDSIMSGNMTFVQLQELVDESPSTFSGRFKF